MFAQHQILGMKTDMLQRIKVEINSWDNVADRHPYSVYNRQQQSTLPGSSGKFTTSFGENLPLRVHDRNQRARQAEAAAKQMVQPYPAGYTGHVPGVRPQFATTYGKQTRSAINGVEPVQSSHSKGLRSTAQETFKAPDDQLAKIVADAHNRPPQRRERAEPSHSDVFASTAQLAYRAPTAEKYLPPTWTERATSTGGQPDTFGHFRESVVHRPKAFGQSTHGSERLKTAGPASNGDGHACKPSHATPARAVTPAAAGRPVLPAGRPAVAAGRSSRYDAWVMRDVRK